MKRLIKKIIGLSVIVPAIMLISCSNIGSGSENGGITPQETPVEKALKELSVSPEKVFKLTDKVTLPTTTSVSGVTITWTASPEGYIETAGTDIGKIKKRDTEDKNITLTATAVKDGENKTKTFTVVVCAENTEPSAQDFAASLAIPSSVSNDMTLPKTVDGYTDAAITWESADENIIKIEDNGSDYKGTVTRNIVDRKVKLTAKVEYKSETATKEFDVNINHIEEISSETSVLIDKYEFTGTEIIYTRFDKDKNKITDGYKYAYSKVEPNLKKAVLTNTASYQGEKWMTKQDVEALLNQMRAELNKLENKNPLTLGDFKTFLSLLPFLDEEAYATDNKIFESLKRMSPGILGEETAFGGLSETEKTAKLKSCIPALKKFVTIQNLWLKAQLSPALYEYTLTKKGDGTYEFSAKTLYDSHKNWYEQKGSYKYESESGTIKKIRLNGYKNASEIWLDLSLRKNDNKRYGTDNVPVQFTQGTPITLTGSEDSISVVITNITVSDAGTMTADISIDGDTAQSYTLQFESDHLN
ncbi:immunoglobulin-like domain-containing protein [Treponema sp. Marseille-Q4130]|uniref:immunoglobulin-like domain-containing protein n=1 Tax=Treponema sp. Marseille-Q4130 TaxID=2766702 RepID=UPI0016522458|nr:immunoglobulin-like domain-containing protein [Treponema sp. Marseille-Q4130]MBC6718904.1 hypothetical protein [Treponema sp. Marseille-Q4130]